MEGTMNATTAVSIVHSAGHDNDSQRISLTLYLLELLLKILQMSTPAEQVDTLIGRVADEHNLALGEAFTQAGPVGKKVPTTAQEEKPVADDLEARLANLRN